jgi:pyruvate-formate lyase-activating enzyme
VNDSDKEVGEIASFVRDVIELRKKNSKAKNGSADITYELLRFHKLAADKYTSLGREYRAATIDPPTKERMSELVSVARRCGLEARFR